MNLSKRETWFIIHVLVPLTPFLGGGILRLIVSGEWFGHNFRMGELAVSLGFLAVFLNQSLGVSQHVIGNPDDKEARRIWAIVWGHVGAMFFVLFALVVVIQTAMVELEISKLAMPLRSFEVIVLFLSIPVIWMAMVMQKHFKLWASI